MPAGPRGSILRRGLALGVLLAVGCGCLPGLPARAADPPYYVRRATWHATLIASLEALERQPLRDEFVPFESDLHRGGQPARRLEVEVTGASALHLIVRGDPTKVWGVANWAEARLVRPDGSVHWLTSPGDGLPGKPDADWSVLKGQHEINLNLHAGLYEPLRIAGRTFDRGIHVLADSEIVVPLDGAYARFEAWIGIDDWAQTRGSVRFSVAPPKTAARHRLWDLLARDFSHAPPRREMRWELEDRLFETAWTPGDHAELARRYAAATRRVPPLATQAQSHAATARDPAGVAAVRALYLESRRLDAALAALTSFDFTALRLALADLGSTHGAKYPRAAEWTATLDRLEAAARTAVARARAPAAPLDAFTHAADLAAQLERLRQDALLANPLLDFERLLLIKRRPVGEPRRSQWADRGLGEYVGMPRQSSWGNGTMPNVDNWDNELVLLSPVRPDGRLTPLWRPPGRRLVSDVDLHFDADRLLFSMPDAQKRWQVWEVGADGQGLRQVTPGDQPDVHCYDACYLPNGQIAFISTAPLQGVPCNAGVIVGMLYVMDADGRNIRQLGFEQDHDYHPVVMNDGRLLYLRWDYTDTPHVWNRVLMTMNPDGTGQMEFYGSNSYWPNAVFFGRPIPGQATKVVGIVTGHHEGRVGDLVLFDAARGRHETAGVVQRIPGRGQPVPALIEDKLTEHNWPKFLHPYPLSEKYFLVIGKPAPDDLWGLYLADVFDNLVLLREEEEFALLEPLPFRPTPRPPVIEDRTHPARPDALVYLEDVYHGPGLRGVPRGTIKALRVFTYHFGYQRMAGIDHRVGTDGPWEIKRVLGTVPVEADGSALFRVPAKTPLSVQPLDAEGKAVALMRSWMTAMPGETLSCVGCHERQSQTALNRPTLALRRPPAELEGWHGPPRGFSFAREVQPVLDRHCVGCHNGTTRHAGAALADLRADQGRWVVYEHGQPTLKTVTAKSKTDLLGKYAGVFEPAYIELRQFVRVGGLESDLHLLPPKEFHADTSELVQLLRRGHHGVQLDAESWDRLITWIDLNAPCQGSWAEVSRIPIPDQPARRRALRQLYGGVDEDAETSEAPPRPPVEPLLPPPSNEPFIPAPELAGWPFSADEARRRQHELGDTARVLDLGEGVRMEFVRVPAGSFVMGDPAGDRDERPPGAVEIRRPFWMSKFEVTNEQYARFNRTHDSRFEHRTSWIFSEAYLGWPLNGPRQPVVRVSALEAQAFCAWLGQQHGLTARLPTEAQWEWACRAGTDTPFAFGDREADFARHANLADASLRRLAEDGWRPRAPDNVPRDARFNDGALVTAEVGQYAPNAWGLHDLHGNAAEWTRSDYRPYPVAADASDSTAPAALKVVRGGSWRDRPARARSAARLAYPAYQQVFNVGFRVVLEGQVPSLQAVHAR